MTILQVLLVDLKPQVESADFEKWFKILGLVGGLGTFIFGVLKWGMETKREFKKPFYIKQLDYYSEAVTATATLATEEIYSADYSAARKEFYRLYWGKLSIVENNDVETQMVVFGNLLEKYEKDQASGNKTIEQNRTALKQASLKLSHLVFKHVTDNFLGSKERKEYARKFYWSESFGK